MTDADSELPPRLRGPGVSCGPVWYPILAEMNAALERLVPDYELRRAGEKWAGLNVYIATGHPELFEETQAIVSRTEELSRAVCEFCGEPGTLHIRGTWMKTVCESCSAAKGFEKMGDVEELAPDRGAGIWQVTTQGGTMHWLNLYGGTYQRRQGPESGSEPSGADGVARPIVELSPVRVGQRFRVVFDTGDPLHDEWRISSEVVRIERIR